MTTFDIGLYQSQKLYNDTGNAVIDRVNTYIESGDDNIPHSMTASENGTYSIPENCPNQSFTTQYPCDRSFDATYDNLLQWWQDFTRCYVDNTASDSNLLISQCSGLCGGGIAEDTRAVINGNNIENLPGSFTDYEDSCGAYSMGGAMQEVGHNLMSGVSDDDNDGQSEHDTGRTFEHDGDYYSTPMSTGYWDELEGDNECGTSVTEPTGSKYVHFHYASCAGSNM